MVVLILGLKVNASVREVVESCVFVCNAFDLETALAPGIKDAM